MGRSAPATPTKASSPTTEPADPSSRFGFVQLEFAFLLGPPDGRYLVRSRPGTAAESVLVLTTLAAPRARSRRSGRQRIVEDADVEPVPTTRATVVRAEPFDTLEEAVAWFDSLREDAEALQAELHDARRIVNRAIAAQRAASANPYLADVSDDRALVTRVGFGPGHTLADGRFAEAWEVPREGGRRAKRSMASPEERFAALLGGREQALACEEHVLRARADLDAGRHAAAALEARVALEAMLARPPEGDDSMDAVEAQRPAVSAAAGAALAGALSPEQVEALDQAVRALEEPLRRYRLRR